MKPIRESQIEKYLVAQVKALGGVCRKLKYIGCRNAPDRVIMMPYFVSATSLRSLLNAPIWVELKAPGKKPTSGQLREHERMRGMGQRVEVIDSFSGVDALIGEMR